MFRTYLKQCIIPIFCAACGIFFTDETVLCPTCLARIRRIVSHRLAITRIKSITVHAVGAYDQPLVSLILAKSSGKRTVAYQLGQLMWQRSVVSHLSFDYIVPVPLHWTRSAWRGYNQADEIARVIGAKVKKPMVHLLKRIKRTPFQSRFEGEERIKNVQNAFQLRAVDPELYKNKHLLLVDDVMTSGATLAQSARELLKLRPASIAAVVIARVA